MWSLHSSVVHIHWSDDDHVNTHKEVRCSQVDNKERCHLVSVCADSPDYHEQITYQGDGAKNPYCSLKQISMLESKKEYF